MSGVILLFEIYFVCVEFCTNGVVLLMFGFFVDPVTLLRLAGE